MENCIFCKIIKGEIPATKIYETEDVFCFLDIKPLNPGHALLIPKAHYTDLFDIPEKLLCTLASETKKVARVVKKVVDADGIGIGQNNGKAAGQVIFHYHIHIIPRFLVDGYKSWERVKGEIKKETPEKIAEKIKTGLKIN